MLRTAAVEEWVTYVMAGIIVKQIGMEIPAFWRYAHISELPFSTWKWVLRPHENVTQNLSPARNHTSTCKCVDVVLFHANRARGEWRYSSIHYYTQHSAVLAGRFMSMESVAGTHCIGRWVGFRNGLEVSEKRKKSVARASSLFTVPTGLCRYK
jgi:hypothetical protein